MSKATYVVTTYDGAKTEVSAEHVSVESINETRVRADFYNGTPHSSAPVAVFLDPTSIVLKDGAEREAPRDPRQVSGR